MVALISIDGMGGDHAPHIVVNGIERFSSRHPDVRFLLHGDLALITPLLAETPDLAARVEVRHSERSIPMDAKPSQILRQARGTSMWNAIEFSVKSGEAQAAVSAGNTGALMAISKLVLRMSEGVHRPALAGSWPTSRGVAAVLDLGADITADAEQLVEFAIMGEAFARAVHHKSRPTVGLLNVGSEEVKGHETLKEAAALIRSCGIDLGFEGFVEGDDISKGAVDVVVTDGFTGNIALKTGEGVARMIADSLKSNLSSSLLSKIGAVIAMPALKRFQRQFDMRSVNGAVFLGLNGLVVKSHGGTDGVGFANAISVAHDLCASQFKTEVDANLRRLVEALRVRRTVVVNGDASS